MRGAALALTMALVAATAHAQDAPPPEAVAEAEHARPETEPDAEIEPARIPGPDYLRAFLEQLAMLGGATLWYWLDDRNVVDWDYDSILQRFDSDVYRFDNNEFPINFVAHALNGSAFYGLSRANRMDVYSSFLYNAITSFMWEFVIEFQERFSLNDTVVTSIGGIPIGEGFIRLGRYLDRAAHPALAWTLGLPVALHEMLDGRAVGHEGDGPPDEPPGWANLSIRYGFEWALLGRDARAGGGFDVQRVRMHGRFVAFEGHREPGRTVRFFTDAEVTEMRIDALFSTTGAGFELYADTVVLGLYAQDLRAHPEGVVGGSVVVGTNVSHLVRFENYDPWNDRLSYTGFPGIAIDAEEHLGAFHARVSGRFNATFGASTAPGYARWRASTPEEILPKSILRKHGYWYGWGWATQLSLELSAYGVTVGGSLGHVRLDSQEGFDRLQEEVVDDVDGISELLEPAAWIRLGVLPLGLFVEASWRGQIRSHRLGHIETDRRLDRFELSVGFAD